MGASRKDGLAQYGVQGANPPKPASINRSFDVVGHQRQTSDFNMQQYKSPDKVSNSFVVGDTITKDCDETSPFKQTREVHAIHNINQIGVGMQVQNSRVNTEFSPQGNRDQNQMIYSGVKSNPANAESVSHRDVHPSQSLQPLDPSSQQNLSNVRQQLAPYVQDNSFSLLALNQTHQQNQAPFM